MTLVFENPRGALVWGLIILFALNFLKWLRQTFRSDLSAIPGPLAARLSVLYRPWKVCQGDAPEFYHGLHQRYGPIVRTAPNAVSISDPSAIAPIYSAGTKFIKVRTNERALSVPDMEN